MTSKKLDANSSHDIIFAIKITIIKICSLEHKRFVMLSCSQIIARTHLGDEIANVNFYAVRPEATRIRRNNAK